MEDDAEQSEQPEQPGTHEPTNRLAESVSNIVSYHIQEYDLTAATVVGVLAIETIRRALHAMQVRIGSEEEDDEDDENDDE